MTTSIQTSSSLYKELKSIRNAIKKENASYSDIAFLSCHQTEVKEYFPDDSLMWEWAGIPEEEWINGR